MGDGLTRDALRKARDEGYRIGIMHAARVAVEGGCCTEGGPCANDACQTRWEVRDSLLRILAFLDRK